MRKKKVFTQTVKRIFHPEMKQCLDCGSRLRRSVTISERTVITLSQVLRVVHCGYRCPAADCPGSKRLYRSMEADALALPGFTFGLDILLLVGQLRLREHQTVDEIHRTLTQRLALIGQTICRREMLFLFEAYTALLRAGTEVSQDAAWKEEVQENKGLLLSVDGIQPDNGNETIYLVRDVLTGRILTRLIYNADHRVKTDMRIRMQQRTHEYRQNMHKRLKEAEEKREENQQEMEQLHILEEYAAMVEGALNIDSLTPFQYGGLAMQEALTKIQTSLEKLEKGGEQ